MSSEFAWMILPSAATSSPALSSTTSPMTTSSAGIAASTPSRRTRAVCFVSDFRAFIALSALPSWRSPTTALNTVSRSSTAPVLHSPMASDSDAGDEQDDLHVAAVLVEEAPPFRNGLLGGKRVGPVLLQQLGGLRRREAVGGVDAEPSWRRRRRRARTTSRSPRRCSPRPDLSLPSFSSQCTGPWWRVDPQNLSGT